MNVNMLDAYMAGIGFGAGLGMAFAAMILLFVLCLAVFGGRD